MLSSADVNDIQQKKQMNPEGFEYDRYFDGFNQPNSLPGIHLENIQHKIDKKTEERKLSLETKIVTDQLSLNKKESITNISKRIKSMQLENE